MPNFDPYHKWLGIRPEEQPVDHYRLLGITLFEDDLDTISSAADQRMTHIRSFQTGTHAAFSQSILNELAAARVCLLNPSKKAAYDQTLHSKLTPPMPPPVVLPKSPVGAELSRIFDMDFTPTHKYKKYKKPTPSWMPWVLPIMGVIVAIVLLMLIARTDRDERGIAKVVSQHLSSIPPKAELKKVKPTSKFVPKPEPEPKVDPDPKPPNLKLNLLEDPKPLRAFEPPKVDPKPEQPGPQAQPKPDNPPKARRPIPDDASQEKAKKLIKEVYGDVWAAAKADSEKQPSSRRINGLVLWNAHNAGYNDRGTNVCIVALLQGRTELWRSSELQIPWAANKDMFLAVPVPRIAADTVRVEIVRWHTTGGGLSEVQAFSGKDNIAQGCRVTASAKWSDIHSESTLTDGITTSAHGKGYWLLPDGIRGWTEIHLRESEQPHLSSSLAKIIQKAKETNKDNAAHFVLLRLCRDIATQTSDYHQAFDVIDLMADEYDLSGPQMKAEVLEQAAKKPRLMSVQKVAIATAALQVIDEAVDEDNFEVATKLGRLARQLVRRTKEKDLLQEIVAKNKQVGTAAKVYADSHEAMATLKDKPDDPEANLVVGKYECFSKGNWDEGLPMLAKGSDDGLKKIAKLDLAEPKESEARASVGDAWWDFVEKADANAKSAAQQRAQYWYELAVPGLSGLAKDKLEKRLLEIRRRVLKGVLRRTGEG